MGNHHGYRKAKVPKVSKSNPKSKGEGEGGMIIEGDDDDNEEEDDEDDDDNYPNWPEKAHHSEDYFGYMLNSGNHMICEALSFLSFLHLVCIN
jgi:hypothetical protein